MTPLPALWAAATTLAAPALRRNLRRRAERGKEIASRLSEREGIEPAARPPGRLVWLHAASVGETVSVLPVVAGIEALASDVTVLVTTGTVTSARLLADRRADMPAGRVLHRFAPLDVPRWVARFLDHWRPDAAVFVESELWPNQLAALRRRGIPAMLANGRLSPRSHRHWRRAPRFARAVLGSFRVVWAQSVADAERLAASGAPSVQAPGNLKFAAPPLPADDAALARAAAQLAARPCWVAASIHPGEDELVIAAHRELVRRYPDLVTLIVPRHPERGTELAARAEGTPVRRRSLGEGPPPQGGLWIGDTIGELGLWYRLARVALVGRSLVAPGGGQNPLEAVRLGCPVGAGPFMDNFAEAASVLERAGALARVGTAAELARWVGAMLEDPPRRAAAVRAGQAAIGRYGELPGAMARAILSLME